MTSASERPGGPALGEKYTATSLSLGDVRSIVPTAAARGVHVDELLGHMGMTTAELVATPGSTA